MKLSPKALADRNKDIKAINILTNAKKKGEKEYQEALSVINALFEFISNRPQGLK